MFKPIAASITTLALAIALAIAVTPAHSAPEHIMPCSAWTHTQYPVIPAHTATNECVTSNGSISHATN